MEQKELKIEIPEGYDIDKEQSSFEKIVFKKKEQEVKTWKDLIGKFRRQSSVYISEDGKIKVPYGITYNYNDENVFIDERHAKSALAMAQISQLMPYYGGAITDEEWEDISVVKYIIRKYKNTIIDDCAFNIFHFLAFHTKEQRNTFLKYNEQLVKEYLMIP